MKRYFRVYFMLIRLNLHALLVYPANFYNSLIATCAWTFFSIYSIVLLTTGSERAFGMTRGEILLLNGAYAMLIGIFHVVFSSNFGRFSSVIHKGDLDSILLKPIDAQFLLSIWIFSWVSLSRIIVAVIYVFFLMQQLAIIIGFLDGLLFLILGSCAIVLLYSIWYIVITTTIWFTRLSNLVELMFNITGIARYPSNMFIGALGAVLLPILLIVNTPVKVYLHTIRLVDVCLLIMLTGFFFVVSRKFWRFALTHYTSASS